MTTHHPIMAATDRDAAFAALLGSVADSSGDPPLSLPGERVMVSSTASSRGAGIRRLPDRVDHEGSLLAVQVETSEEAQRLLGVLDRTGRRLYVDVEAKQDIDLLKLASETVRFASVYTIKPNDATVDATEAFLLHHHGLDLADRAVAVFGTGNLGFKIALRLAERRAIVQLFGRDDARVARATAAINAILPRHTEHLLQTDGQQEFGTLISAVAARAVIGTEWLQRLEPQSLILDVGINNLTAGLIATAQSQHHTCARLDIRAAPYPVPPARNHFFESVMGRGIVAGISVVAGGLIGRAGEIVVDQVPKAQQVVGVADGTGGLVPPPFWSPEQRGEVADLETHIRTARP